MHRGQADLSLRHTHRMRWTIVFLTGISRITGSVIEFIILESVAFGDAGIRIRLPVLSANRHIVGWTIAGKAGVRVIGDALDSTLLLRAGNLSSETTANVTFDVEPSKVGNRPSRQATTLVANTR